AAASCARDSAELLHVLHSRWLRQQRRAAPRLASLPLQAASSPHRKPSLLHPAAEPERHLLSKASESDRAQYAHFRAMPLPPPLVQCSYPARHEPAGSDLPSAAARTGVRLHFRQLAIGCSRPGACSRRARPATRPLSSLRQAGFFGPDRLL